MALLQADLDLLRELDALDQFRWTAVDNNLADPAVVAARTCEALARFGLDPEAVPVPDAAQRVSASVVRQRVVPALDRLLRQQKQAEVHALLRRVDADAYRDAVRDAVLADDRAKLTALAGQEAALEQPAGFAAFLGESGVIAPERRRQLLTAALSRRPGDLGLLMTLGKTYPFNETESAGERVRWFQAAVAVAPDNTTAHNNLAASLADQGQVDEAIACYPAAHRGCGCSGSNLSPRGDRPGNDIVALGPRL